MKMMIRAYNKIVIKKRLGKFIDFSRKVHIVKNSQNAIRNIGILAHIDAGKLTEIIFEALMSMYH